MLISDDKMLTMDDESLRTVIKDHEIKLAEIDEKILKAMKGILSEHPSVPAHRVALDEIFWTEELKAGKVTLEALQEAQRVRANAMSYVAVINTAKSILFQREEKRLREEFLEGKARENER